MNRFLCFSLLLAVASAAPKPQPTQWAYSVQDESLKPGSWYGAGSYVSSAAPTGYWQSQYSPSIHHSAEIAPKNWFVAKAPQYSVPTIARSDSSAWKVEPASWSGASYAPQSWSAGLYSAAPAKVEKQIIFDKNVPAPVKFDQAQPVADSTPKFISYSTEITHDVPTKREEVPSIVSAARSFAVAPQVAPQVAPVPKVISAPAQYSAWVGEAKPVAEVKPAQWASEVKPAGWSSEVKPVGWTSEVKPASWSWSEPKPASWAAWAPEAKPASWSSWSEAKPWSSYVSPVQPAFYGASWGQPTVSTNAHHAISAPWSSTWSSAPVAWNEPIQKRSERKPF